MSFAFLIRVEIHFLKWGRLDGIPWLLVVDPTSGGSRNFERGGKLWGSGEFSPRENFENHDVFHAFFALNQCQYLSYQKSYMNVVY